MKDLYAQCLNTFAKNTNPHLLYKIFYSPNLYVKLKLPVIMDLANSCVQVSGPPPT
jgi:hypothetical protein